MTRELVLNKTRLFPTDAHLVAADLAYHLPKQAYKRGNSEHARVIGF